MGVLISGADCSSGFLLEKFIMSAHLRYQLDLTFYIQRAPCTKSYDGQGSLKSDRADPQDPAHPTGQRTPGLLLPRQGLHQCWANAPSPSGWGPLTPTNKWRRLQCQRPILITVGCAQFESLPDFIICPGPTSLASLWASLAVLTVCFSQLDLPLFTTC